VQANVADLSRFEDAAFDGTQPTMFLHATSYRTMPKIFAETRRLLKPGGVVLHVEQPQNAAHMPLFEQAMRDWDPFHNNEPFWTKMHELDLDARISSSPSRASGSAPSNACWRAATL
jgi:ubiquinone/menaquinone biosynthesis C-methylase UbiE